MGWTCGLRSPSRIGLELGLVLRIRWHWPDLDLDLDFEAQLGIGLGLGLGLRGPTRIGLELGLGLRSPTRNWTWTSGPENRTLVKSAAAKSDFGFVFGLGLRALPCQEANAPIHDRSHERCGQADVSSAYSVAGVGNDAHGNPANGQDLRAQAATETGSISTSCVGHCVSEENFGSNMFSKNKSPWSLT